MLIALAAGLYAGLTACASVDPPAAPASFTPTPLPRPVPTEKPNPERKRLIDAFGGIYSAPATQAYLAGVLTMPALALPPIEFQTPFEPATPRKLSELLEVRVILNLQDAVFAQSKHVLVSRERCRLRGGELRSETVVRDRVGVKCVDAVAGDHALRGRREVRRCSTGAE